LIKRARAFCPAGVSSFFEVCDRKSNEELIENPDQIGARGGGFSPNKGVITEVIVFESNKKQVQVTINKNNSLKAETTRSVLDLILNRLPNDYNIKVNHYVEVPIGAGFGSSAAGALGTAIALNQALDLNLTYNQLGRIAHIAEIECKTGLGTVGPIMYGGCGLTIEPGAPGIAYLDQIPIPPDIRLLIGTFRPYPTKEILSSQKNRKKINFWGKKTLKRILNEPSLENFMAASKIFAVKSGFATNRVLKLIKQLEKKGAIGATQNMLGEAVHALVKKDQVSTIYNVFKKMLPEEKIIIATIDHQGARLIE
jgi:pantoate kinase